MVIRCFRDFSGLVHDGFHVPHPIPRLSVPAPRASTAARVAWTSQLSSSSPFVGPPGWMELEVDVRPGLALEVGEHLGVGDEVDPGRQQVVPREGVDGPLDALDGDVGVVLDDEDAVGRTPDVELDVVGSERDRFREELRRAGAAAGQRSPSTSFRPMAWWAWLLVGIGVLAVVYAAFVVALVLVGRRGDARAMATFIPDCIVLVSRLARDNRVPQWRKLLLFALAGYLAMPFDLVPDFIPVAGVLDDAVIVVWCSAPGAKRPGPARRALAWAEIVACGSAATRRHLGSGRCAVTVTFVGVSES